MEEEKEEKLENTWESFSTLKGTLKRLERINLKNKKQNTKINFMNM